MRRIRNVFFSLFIACMLCAAMPAAVSAASAQLRFTDPSTTVGAEVEVTGRLSSTSNIETMEATLTYDADMLRFISGDEASGGDGTITVTGTGSSSTVIEFTLTFQALEEGTAKVEVSQSSGTDVLGMELDITNGSSAVTIGPGDPSLIVEGGEGGEGGQSTVAAEGPQVEVDGRQYKITGGFSDALIPGGFARSEIAFEGVNCEAVTQQSGRGESALYLTPLDGGEPSFFLYNSDNGSFIPFEEVEIAADRYLVILRDDGSVKVPEDYKVTKLTLNGKELTAWQDPTKAEYYIIYGLNTDGDKVLYQYDTVDGTYQRYIPQASSEGSGKKAAKGIWGKILHFVESMLDIVLIVTFLLFVVLIIILIVVGVKLYRRNVELDDLYDEYGIDTDDDDDDDDDDDYDARPVKKRKEEPPKEAKGKKKAGKKPASQPAVRVPVKTMNLREEGIFDDYEFDDKDDYDDYEFDDDSDASAHDGIGYDYDEESGGDIDDLDELLSRQPKKKRGHTEKDDAFQVDFIDLD